MGPQSLGRHPLLGHEPFKSGLQKWVNMCVCASPLARAVGDCMCMGSIHASGAACVHFLSSGAEPSPPPPSRSAKPESLGNFGLLSPFSAMTFQFFKYFFKVDVSIVFILLRIVGCCDFIVNS